MRTGEVDDNLLPMTARIEGADEAIRGREEQLSSHLELLLVPVSPLRNLNFLNFRREKNRA